MSEQNHVYTLTPTGEVASSSASDEALDRARARARAILRGGQTPSMRTCWECNPAHNHFLDGDWGDWVLVCAVGCGRFYCDATDITHHAAQEPHP